LISVKRWNRGRFFSQNFAVAFAVAAALHLAGASLFRIASLQLGGNKKSAPPVAAFARLPAAAKAAAEEGKKGVVPEPQYHALALPPFPSAAALPAALPSDIGEPEERGFYPLEDRILAERISSPEIPLLIPPVAVRVSGPLAEIPFTATRLGLEGVEQPFLPSQIRRSRERYSVVVDPQSGKIIWHEFLGIKSSGKVEKMLKDFQFKKTEALFPLRGEIELILTERISAT